MYIGTAGSQVTAPLSKHYPNFLSLADEGSARAHCILQGLLDSHCPTSGWEASALVDVQRPDKGP